jgi:predicted transcriptional regulator
VKPNVVQVREWANQLAGETRDSDWLCSSYIPPEVFEDVHEELKNSKRGLIGLVGQQGVGKSSALMALQKGIPFRYSRQRVLFKWHRKAELFKALLTFTHEATDVFVPLYLLSLAVELRSKLKEMNEADKKKFDAFHKQADSWYLGREDRDLVLLDICWAEARLGKAASQVLRMDTWLKVLSEKAVILIDTPDYSKTDKRQMDGDLQEIYWFWNQLISTGCDSTIVVAVQKEMFRDHFFLDKMRKFELKPLAPERMVESYRVTFGSTSPFTEEALLTIARLSRGIYRRYLRYITMTLDYWSKMKANQSDCIEKKVVKMAIPFERLVEDMESEFAGLFPKHSDLATLAVRVIMSLQENGSHKQSQLTEELGVEPSTMSRLLTKLESSKHIIRSRIGVDKIVSLPMGVIIGAALETT